MKNAQHQMYQAKQYCESIAEGEFTPIVIHMYINSFSGKTEILIGRPSGNRGGIV